MGLEGTDLSTPTRAANSPHTPRTPEKVAGAQTPYITTTLRICTGLLPEAPDGAGLLTSLRTGAGGIAEPPPERRAGHHGQGVGAARCGSLLVIARLENFLGRLQRPK